MPWIKQDIFKESVNIKNSLNILNLKFIKNMKEF